MTVLDNLKERFPKWLDTVTSSSAIYQFIDAVAKEIDRILVKTGWTQSQRWVGTATGNSLDSFGILFKLSRGFNESDADYRARLRSAISSFLGGGTLVSIKANLKAYYGLAEDPVIREPWKVGDALDDPTKCWGEYGVCEFFAVIPQGNPADQVALNLLSRVKAAGIEAHIILPSYSDELR